MKEDYAELLKVVAGVVKWAETLSDAQENLNAQLHALVLQARGVHARLAARLEAPKS